MIDPWCTLNLDQNCEFLRLWAGCKIQQLYIMCYYKLEGDGELGILSPHPPEHWDSSNYAEYLRTDQKRSRSSE